MAVPVATCATADPNGSDAAAVNASNELMRTLITDLNLFILNGYLPRLSHTPGRPASPVTPRQQYRPM
jgi:hypothetical protein